MAKLILVVEDNRDDQLFILSNLKKSTNYKVICTPDGSTAKLFLENQNQDLPSLIILDLSLPKVSGLDFLQALRANERTKFIPVVVLSSSKEHLDIQRAFTYGCNSYLYKPIVYEEFRDLMLQISDYWCLRNVSPTGLAVPSTIDDFPPHPTSDHSRVRES
jgi:CheY-like chemotaxis protein